MCAARTVLGNIAERDERLLPGVALEYPKAAAGEHPLTTLNSRRDQNLVSVPDQVRSIFARKHDDPVLRIPASIK